MTVDTHPDDKGSGVTIKNSPVLVTNHHANGSKAPMKLVLSLIYLSNRSGAAAVAQRPVHELQRCGGCNNPGFESLAAVGDPHERRKDG